MAGPAGNFASRLRELCSQAGSASAVARDLGINRQQFARYLNGTSVPRANIVRSISKYFGVDEGALFSSHTLDAPSGRPASAGVELISTYLSECRFTDPTEEVLPSGFYEIYKVSFRYEGKIFVGLCQIKRKDGAVLFKRRTSARYVAWPVGAAPRNVYTGVFLYKGGQIVLFDYGTETKDITVHVFIERLHYDAMTKPGIHLNFGVLPIESGKAARVVLRKLPDDTKTVLAAARAQGFRTLAETPSDILYLLETEITPDHPILRIKL